MASQNDERYGPMNQHTLDWSGVALSVEPKLWLIKEMVENGVRLSALAKRYFLSRPWLVKIRKRWKKGGTINFPGGRPRLLDDDALDKAKQIWEMKHLWTLTCCSWI